MSTRSLTAVVAGIIRATSDAMLRDFRPDCCIATTRTVMRVLRHYGFDCEPLVVRAMIFNRAYVQAIDKHTAKTERDADWRAWPDATGAHSVGLGFATGAPGFVGHLVALVPSAGRFIDASLSQASRPLKDIELPPAIAVPVTESFLTTAGERLALSSGDGMLLVYERIMNDDYRSSPDWRDKTRTKRAMKAIIEHIETTA
jgi:hypothetical protein